MVIAVWGALLAKMLTSRMPCWDYFVAKILDLGTPSNIYFAAMLQRENKIILQRQKCWYDKRIIEEVISASLYELESMISSPLSKTLVIICDISY